jgi:8-oxo-dGTP pyrophosphatase MutT (NUDIX family)
MLSSQPHMTPSVRDCVGALIFDADGRVFLQRRTMTRRVWPGGWDIVGGHVHGTETHSEALVREVAEETGWSVSRIGPIVADWTWEHDGEWRREIDYLIQVEGDLSAPRLDEREHDAWAWVRLEDVDGVMPAESEVERTLGAIVSAAVRNVRLARQVAERFATALDHSDYDAAMSLLGSHADYVTAPETLHGPVAIIASYREHDEWARQHLQAVEYESSVRVDSDRAVVTFIDHLAHEGATHTYACEQLMWVDDAGLITRIEHREIPGQREGLEAFLERVGIRRSRTAVDRFDSEVQ